MYAQQLFYDKFSLTSLNVVGSLHKVHNTPLANVLLGSIYFDKFSLLTGADEEVFTLPIFSMTSELVTKLACKLFNKRSCCYLKTQNISVMVSRAFVSVCILFYFVEN